MGDAGTKSTASKSSTMCTKNLEKKLEDTIGKRCKKRDPFCFVCINYEAVDVLKETFEIYRKVK